MAKPPPPRAWQRMLSGRRLDLLDPSPLDIEIEDIAHGIARVPRWNGQTRGAHIFSVAQHSLVVEEISRVLKPDLADRWRLAILLHDAPEYVVADLISPFKAMLGGNYKIIEKRLMTAIHLRFGLPADIPDVHHKLLKKADQAAAYMEATKLAGFDKDEALKYFGRPAGIPANLDLTPWPADKAEKRFLARFNALCEQ
ncbi:hydrolase [Terrihabitans soli]|uniref:Hydrolase n=1 Tax=Terrihabitans soli TaxID=708113 RepID=A0A6S6QIX6_9HYPH|nr:HD family hydrolase [Terrihabitans soli]BCJ90204.1 hydrolase [Terrihabitans soli]